MKQKQIVTHHSIGMLFNQKFELIFFKKRTNEQEINSVFGLMWRSTKFIHKFNQEKSFHCFIVNGAASHFSYQFVAIVVELFDIRMNNRDHLKRLTFDLTCGQLIVLRCVDDVVEPKRRQIRTRVRIFFYP